MVTGPGAEAGSGEDGSERDERGGVAQQEEPVARARDAATRNSSASALPVLADPSAALERDQPQGVPAESARVLPTGATPVPLVKGAVSALGKKVDFFASARETMGRGRGSTGAEALAGSGAERGSGDRRDAAGTGDAGATDGESAAAGGSAPGEAGAMRGGTNAGAGAAGGAGNAVNMDDAELRAHPLVRKAAALFEARIVKTEPGKVKKGG
ncbi:hypothetical protein BH11PLA1_BH11PLA1_07080 [soil metagenome]